jgi:hypothetical protein
MTERRIKFIACDDIRITSEVDGCGLGFSHVGCKSVARSMGYQQPGWVSYSVEPVNSNTLKAWNGSPAVIGWLIMVDVHVPSVEEIDL